MLQLDLTDAGSSTRSLSILLLAMETSLRIQTALEIGHWASAALLVRAFVCRTYKPSLLFEGSIRFTQSSWLRGYYLRVATIQGWRLFKGGDYSRVASNQRNMVYCKPTSSLIKLQTNCAMVLYVCTRENVKHQCRTVPTAWQGRGSENQVHS